MMIVFASSYVQYANICAQITRNSVKEQFRAAALRRDGQSLRFAKWENGKQGTNGTLHLDSLTDF